MSVRTIAILNKGVLIGQRADFERRLELVKDDLSHILKNLGLSIGKSRWKWVGDGEEGFGEIVLPDASGLSICCNNNLSLVSCGILWSSFVGDSEARANWFRLVEVLSQVIGSDNGMHLPDSGWPVSGQAVDMYFADVDYASLFNELCRLSYSNSGMVNPKSGELFQYPFFLCMHQRF